MRRGPRPVAERLRRLLVVLPWLMERREVSVIEISERFRIDPTELVRDLEMVAMCGLPPFIDEMIDVYIDEGMVYAGVPRLFTKPLRLTAPEGFALLIAGRAALQLPGADPAGPLARALDKLAVVLGGDAVVVDAPQPPAAGEIISAASDGARMRVRYWSARREAAGDREITPRTVFLDRGHWYVIADDHQSGEERIFRLDRFEHWERTGVVDPGPVVAAPHGDDWFVDADLPSVTLRLRRSARWVAERYPVREMREVDGDGEVHDDGELEVTLAVTSERWLRALLLRLGVNATVTAPDHWVDLGSRAAAELLENYSVDVDVDVD
ncbi:MAG: WYL domain-containing protein, partial [Ilumatobacteraceae bacterium]